MKAGKNPHSKAIAAARHAKLQAATATAEAAAKVAAAEHTAVAGRASLAASCRHYRTELDALQQAHSMLQDKLDEVQHSYGSALHDLSVADAAVEELQRGHNMVSLEAYDLSERLRKAKQGQWALLAVSIMVLAIYSFGG